MTAALPEGAWVNPSTPPPPWAVDAVVLDVDGVLIDVSGSFREVVRATVAAMQTEAGITEPWVPGPADLTAFKRAGGFNDDVDLSIALTAIGAAGRGDAASAIAAAVGRAGGGLGALRTVAPDLPRITGRRVLEVFDTIYWGDGETVGLIRSERPLVAASLLDDLQRAGAAAVALITGRTPRELASALALLGWERGRLAAVVTGDTVRKPDPACLDIVVEATGAHRLLFAGDVRDDWELVRRHRAQRAGGASVLGVLVGDDAEMAEYRPLGPDATVRSAVDLVGMIRG